MTTQCDLVELALGATETVETSIGTINFPSQGVSRIIGVSGTCNALTTTAEAASGNFRLAFKSVPGTFKFPVTVNQGPAGTLASPGWEAGPRWIPVNIPVPPNEAVQCLMTLNVAQTGACRGQIALLME